MTWFGKVFAAHNSSIHESGKDATGYGMSTSISQVDETKGQAGASPPCSATDT